MKTKAFYLPGKTGDAILQWPVADLYLKEEKQTAEVWLDPSCKVLVPLFEAQPNVTKVKLVEPAEHYGCGGQPWQGKFSTEDHTEYEIIPLGFRQFPARQITLQTALDVPFHVSTARLATEKAFDVGPIERQEKVVIHGTFNSHTSGVPKFWRFLKDISKDLEERFGPDSLYFTGTADERARAKEIYPAWNTYDDEANFLHLARFMAGAALVVGSGSCGVALASTLKVPSVRIHDPIGDAPKAIWSGLGDRQWNWTEIEARKGWPQVMEAIREVVPAEPAEAQV